MSLNNTDIAELFTELDAGVFEQKLGHALSDAAVRAMEHRKAATITVKLVISPVTQQPQI